jgi:E3 ubiquitin-protein ligase listerin
MHHAPALFLHPSRRLRTLALTTHAEILRAEPLRAQMFFFLREIASAEQVESILGSWCMATRDQDRHVAPVAQSSWDTHVSFAPADAEAAADASSLDRTVDKEVGEGEDEKLVLDSTEMAALLVFVQRALLDPLALHANLNPVQVPVDVSVPKTVRGKPVPTVSAALQTRRTDSEPMVRVKGESEEENETDRKARLRIGALGALQWILGTYTSSVLGIPLFLRVYARYSLSETWTQVTRRCTRHPIRCATLELSFS